MEAIVFPDPIAAARAWLVARLGDVPVAQKMPATATDELVQLVRTGGQRVSLVIDRAQVTVTAWARTDIRSAELANLARAHLGAMQGATLVGATVYEVAEIGGPYSNPDPDSGQPRHTFTVAISVRGTATQQQP